MRRVIAALITIASIALVIAPGVAAAAPLPDRLRHPQPPRPDDTPDTTTPRPTTLYFPQKDRPGQREVVPTDDEVLEIRLRLYPPRRVVRGWVMWQRRYLDYLSFMIENGYGDPEPIRDAREDQLDRYRMWDMLREAQNGEDNSWSYRSDQLNRLDRRMCDIGYGGVGCMPCPYGPWLSRAD